MRHTTIALAALLATVPGCGGDDSAPADGGGVRDGADLDARADGGAALDASRWTLAWSDEFDGADGTAPDPSKWTALTGGDGWGNQERELYTTDLRNASVRGGSLVITATTDGAAGHTCWYGACRYTSARLQTKGKLDQRYGRFEAKIRIPRGQGLWPAFWMLGANIDGVPWPGCGEIDVMENIGREPGIVHGSLHGPGYSGGMPLTGQNALPMGGKLADDFHIYAVEWEPTVIRFYRDDVLYETQTAAQVPAGSTWVFDHPFFLLLNVAVGGGWPGDPDGTTVFPQAMQVDWVRVYR